MRGNKIVLDLEFTPIRDADLQAIASSEILEIGAVKLNEQNEILGEFQTYVRPRYSVIPPYITKITGIQEEKVEHVPGYESAVQDFIQWVGTAVPSRFYTWSNSDQCVMLREAELKETALPDMCYAHWIDLQRIHQRLYGFSRAMNLTRALGSMEIYFEGTEHGALADARNTASILQSMSDMKRVQNQIAQSRVTYNHADSHGFPMQMVFKSRSD